MSGIDQLSVNPETTEQIALNISTECTILAQTAFRLLPDIDIADQSGISTGVIEPFMPDTIALDMIDKTRHEIAATGRPGTDLLGGDMGEIPGDAIELISPALYGSVSNPMAEQTIENLLAKINRL
mgnify:CR=1 FL=1